MKTVECRGCGSRELVEQQGLLACPYCRSTYVPQAEDRPQLEAAIGIESDVRALLQKCRDDPANRRLYANLVLDIDPTNREAIGFLS